MASKCWSCFGCILSRKKQKFLLLYEDGENRIQNALDVKQLIETHQSVYLLKKLLLRPQSRMLFRLQRGNLLEFGGSESDLSSVCSDDISALRHETKNRENFVEQFTNWKARSSFDKKLVLGIMHRKGHKNFEEREEETEHLSQELSHSDCCAQLSQRTPALKSGRHGRG